MGITSTCSNTAYPRTKTNPPYGATPTRVPSVSPDDDGLLPPSVPE